MTTNKKGCRTTLVHAISAEFVLARPMLLRFGPSPSRWPRPVRPLKVSFPSSLLVSLAIFLSRIVSDRCCSARSPEAPSAGRRWPLAGPRCWSQWFQAFPAVRLTIRPEPLRVRAVRYPGPSRHALLVRAVPGPPAGPATGLTRWRACFPLRAEPAGLSRMPGGHASESPRPASRGCLGLVTCCSFWTHFVS